MKKSLLTLLVMLLTVSMSWAQITTSAMAGKVTDAQGELIGANVVATHVPSGTKYGTITNDKGRFSIQGMRVGGPYTVTISYVGAEPKTFDNIILQLGETYNLSCNLEESAALLEEAVVIGSASKFTTQKTGAVTNISAAQITSLPTITRSITDYTRLSPYGGNGMTFGGTDGRTGNFSVDGANFNNNFGLNEGLPGGGNPISIDAIEEMQLVVSPFDVRQTNFLGGAINAITKSGTNTFKGTAYVYHRNENMRGDAIEREQLSGVRAKDQQTTWGFTLGGPILKNKLFFFANAEWQRTPTVPQRWRASEDGKADPNNYLSRTSVADMQAASDYVTSRYGYDPGSFTAFPANEENYKFLIRLDWNITDKHHLAVRYNQTKNTRWSAPNASSMDGGVRMSGARTSQYSMAFANNMYSQDNIVKSVSVDLNSRFSDKFSNQLLFTYSKLDDVRGTNSSEFPHIDILDGDITGGDPENIYMSLGYELFTWNNAVHNTVWNIKDDATYYFGSHKLMAGVVFEHQMADNQYMRNGSGYYRYKSLSDFLNGATPQIVNLTYGYDGESSPAARVQFNRPGIYAQDEWDITDRVKLTYGLRLDWLLFDNSDLMTNGQRYTAEDGTEVRTGILGRDYYDGNGNLRYIDTGKWPDNSLTFSPRVGVTWDVFGDRTLKVRGGTGLFAGRLPLVFFTNMPTNGGLVQYQAQIGPNTKYAALPDAVKAKYSNMDAVLNEFKGGLITDANGKATAQALHDKLISMGFPDTVTPADGSVPGSISAVDPGFKMPQVWKTSVAVDYQFPVSFPLSITAEGIFNKTINDVCISDWSIPSVGGFARFNGADNRPIYPSGFRNGTKAFILENTSKGYGWIASVELNAKPADWISIYGAYTHTVKKEVTSMPGSAAESAFTYVPTYEGPNNIKLHNALNVTPDRFVADVTIHDKASNHYSFIYETWRGGYKYSYMLSNDMNGDGYAYDAVYIPTDKEVADGLFRFASEDDKERFMDYVHKDDYLKDHQGEYAEPYSVYNPWVHRIDFSYKHDFNFNIAKTKHTIQLSFDIKNVLNLFNSSWGVSKYLNPEIGNEARILKYEGVDKEGFATFSTPESISGDTETWVRNHEIGQCWYASFGVKYIFN